MTETSANDLERAEIELNRIARDYTTASQELDQYVITLEGAVSHIMEAGPQGWKGLSSAAFVAAWLERKTRMLQASLLLNEVAGYLTRMARVIEDNVPLIRAEQSIQLQPVFQSMSSNDQQSVLDAESQAQQAITMALAVLNGQLEHLGEEIGDCPQEDREAGEPWYERNISRNDAGGGATPEGGAVPGDGEEEASADGFTQLTQYLQDAGLSKKKIANILQALLDGGMSEADVAQFMQQLQDTGLDQKQIIKFLSNPEYIAKIPEIWTLYQAASGVPNINSVLFDLANGSQTSFTGSYYQLQWITQYVEDHPNGPFISDVEATIDGRKGPDVVLDDGTVIDLKSYDWSKLPQLNYVKTTFGDGKTVEQDIEEQILRYKEKDPNGTIIYIANSKYGTIPQSVLDIFKKLGVQIEYWP